MRVGFIGLGIMGRGMVKNLVANGHEVRLWNRTVTTAEKLFPGLIFASSPAELVRGTEVVISCVSGPDAVERVIFAEDGVLTATRPAMTYIECSTIGPEQAARIEGRLNASGADMLAAPITGSKLGAQNGTLVFMTGGSDELSARMKPLLMSMGEHLIHCGSVPQAFVMKLVNNSLVSFMLEGLCEGVVALSKNDVPLRKWLEVMQTSILSSKFYALKGDALATRDFSTHFSLDLLVKDQSLMLDLASRSRVPMPGLSAIREVFRGGQAQGLGGDDMAGVVRVLEMMTGDWEP